MRKSTAPQLLVQSIVELAEHKNLDKITIREIVNNCGLSSQTFYNHFNDKYDLMLYVYNLKGRVLLQQYKNREISLRELLLLNLQFLKDHSSFMINAYTNTHGADSYRIKSSENSIQMFTEYMQEAASPEGLTEEHFMHIRMFVYACTEITFFWILKHPDTSAETMVEYLYDAIPASLLKLLD